MKGRERGVVKVSHLCEEKRNEECWKGGIFLVIAVGQRTERIVRVFIILSAGKNDAPLASHSDNSTT